MTLPGLVTERHAFRVPLDHGDPSRGDLEIFAREVRGTGPAASGLPWLVYLQGGPGFQAPRPLAATGWIGRAVSDFRVLLVDQRGTGGSTAQVAANITAVGDAAAQADHLALFRADSIVLDLERIRAELGVDRWTVLGQSFGGFCAVHYLSTAPDGLAGAMITGGLPGLDATAEEVYARTFPLVAMKNEAFHRRFGGAAERVRAVFERVARGGVVLPSGDPLSPERLQSIGIALGGGSGAAQLDHMFEHAFVPGTDELTPAFLCAVEERFPFVANPLYAVLHEACYAQGPATRWAADRVRARFPRFDPQAALDEGRTPYLVGEMIHPWFTRDCAALRPLDGVAHALAEREGWARLYDADALAGNEVPVAALVYHEDMFVPTDLSLRTAEGIRGLDPWVTNEYEHDGLRADGERVFERLLERMRASARVL